ncbi:MAG: 3-deoxy-7-phosphoheptulonate synthase [bacterium]|nr:3-deoxy-7-phosphoheptulonate synthase [bacterium]
MIIHLKNTVGEEEAKTLARENEAIIFKKDQQYVLVTSSKLKELPKNINGQCDEYFVTETDIQLASSSYKGGKQEIQVGSERIGGDHHNTLMITGPCSIESWEQIEQSAKLLKELNISTLRAGCFKPRTSPYTFQGLGEEGLMMLVEVRKQYGLNIITEVKDSTHVDLVIEHADIVQIGAKAMYDQSILHRCGEVDKPVLLKRGFGTTLQEFVQAAEFIMSKGNQNVMLCERGIRTFENNTRFTLDLCGVAFLKEKTSLPVIVDPSHAMGFRYGVPDLTRASVAMGVEGLLIETHPTPEIAKSDAAQQLNFEEFRSLYQSLEPIASAVGKTIV